MNYPNEVLPSINWENPNTDGIVAVFMVVDGVVTEIITGTQGVGTPTITTTDGGSGWTGEVEFNFSDIGISDPSNVGDELAFTIYGTIATNSSGYYVSIEGAENDYHKFASSYASNKKQPFVSGRGQVYGDVGVSVNETKTASLGFNLIRDTNQYGAYPRFTVSDYYNGAMLPLVGQSVRNAAEPNLTKVVVGNANHPINYVVFYNKTRTLEQFELTDNAPFDIFQTQEDVNDEYYLQCDTALNTSVSFDVITALAGEDFTLEIEYKNESAGYAHLIAGATSSNYIFKQNGLRIKLGGADAQTGVGVGDLLDKWYHLKLVRTGSNLIGYLDGVEVYNEIDSTGAVTLWRLDYADSYSSRHSYKLVKFINNTAPTNNRYWEFNQTSGTTVVDHINGAVATLVGFSGDDSQWQRILTLHEFTVGDIGNVSYDYEFTSSMIDSVKSIDGHVVLNVMENCTIDTVFVDAGNYTLTIDGQIPFNGNENDTINNRFIDATAASSRAFLMYKGATFKNMLIDAGNNRVWQNAKEKTLIDSVGLVYATPTSLNVSASSSSEITIKNSQINNIDISGSSSQAVGSTVNLINTVLATRAVVREYGTLNVQNGIFKNSDWVLNIYTGSKTNVSNSKFSGSTTADTTDLGGNSFDVDMSTWFDANGQITEDGQTALSGQGWNGSDICSWAYAVSGGLSLEILKSFSWSIREQITKNDNISWSITQPLTNTQGLGWAINEAVFSTKDMSWSINNALSSVKNISWDVNGLLNITKDLSWDIRESIENTKDINWSVRGFLTNNKELDWSIREQITTNQDIYWSTLKLITTSKDTSWSIFKNTSKTQPIKWGILEAVGFVTKPQSLSWSIREYTESTKSFGWSIRENLNSYSTLDWSIREGLSSSQNIDWSIRQSVEREQEISSSIHRYVDSNQDVQWDLRGYLSNPQNISWSIEGLTAVEVVTDISWKIRGNEEYLQSISWDITTNLTGKRSPRSRLLYVNKDYRTLVIPKEYRVYTVI